MAMDGMEVSPEPWPLTPVCPVYLQE
jgi:hypothetical protein